MERLIWTRPERGNRGPAAGHSRAELAAVAVTLADRSGLAAVSMRQVAAELGTGPSSLYRYLGGRTDLLDLMADAVAGEIELGVPLGGDPVEDLLALAVRAKAVHLRHPWLAELPPEPLRLGPHGLAYLEFALRAMAPARLPGPARLEVVAVVDALVAQFARTQRQQGAAGADRRAAQAAYLGETAAAGAYPHLAAALAGAPGGDPAGDPEALFGRTVRRVLGALLAGGTPD
ncbi:TetR/AcrR family transcriptional regulator [Streptomyces albidoflavus]|uniref:TetR/AcrR family transcriptional regulator n=1 Tax=Streptomyces albidoflavus TaxID=1886 RepID=UPI00101ECDBC|nr:helix-turn-helix domain-containing protein [Streptomyces albidoflavus]MBV7653461.1 TetR/AcrR family transcriptional regulator [Streptomyces albidoflavus]MBV7708914.1 TetR/AcrR family transcriptional regulator [Streptomyces albidoflavus]RZE07293.1 TetR family transcriptional regulator [Streptomyces albidoflavus]